MKVILLYNEVDPQNDDAAAVDVLQQLQAITDALWRLGHDPLAIGCTLNLEMARSRILSAAADVVFNLVESLAGSDRLMPAVTLLLESLSIPFTGSGTKALFESGDKLYSKRILQASGIQTPAHFDAISSCWKKGFQTVTPPQQFIVKSIFEHASIGINDDSIRPFQDLADLESKLHSLEQQSGLPAMAEEYIDGREFNLSLLECNSSVQVLAPAEIVFKDYPPGKPRIVGYLAKWDQDSPEYQCTPRNFDFDPSDAPLLDRLTKIATQCFTELGMQGYARVDFRVPFHDPLDPSTLLPFVLEVNANPCLSPDAGFAAALDRSGISFDTAIASLLDSAQSVHGKTAPCS